MHRFKLKLNNYSTWEWQFIEIIQGKTLSKPLYIGNIYRPPKENLEFLTNHILFYAITFLPKNLL